MKTDQRGLSQPTSILLDGVRFSASIFVVIGHFTQRFFSSGWPDLSLLAVNSVAVFFVLSGLVIEFARTRHPDLKDYLHARLVRLWSVVIPALIFTAVADLISWSVNPEFYSTWFHSPYVNLVNFIGDILFLNQSWAMDLPFGSDNPIWSLGYEAPYYVLFGAFIYLRGRGRALVIAALTIIKGPQLLLLLPVWALGVVTCRILVRPGSRLVPGFAALALGALLYFLRWRIYEATLFIQAMPGGLGRSDSFVLSFIVGLATSGAILLADAAKQFWRPLALRIERPVRWLARSTFSIYLFHFPTLVLIQAVTRYSKSSMLSQSCVFISTILICISVSFVTERKKNWWNRPVGFLLRRFSALFQGKPAVRAQDLSSAA
jgi:peptidoglycan/LPS O-acetylase OafA/YrhL